LEVGRDFKIIPLSMKLGRFRVLGRGVYRIRKSYQKNVDIEDGEPKDVDFKLEIPNLRCR